MRGEGGGGCEILFRFVSVPDTCTTIEILFLFSFYKIKKKKVAGGMGFFRGKGDSTVQSYFLGISP